MIPTRLAVWMFICSLALLPLQIVYAPAVWVLCGYDLFLFILMFADALLARRIAGHLLVRRERPARFSLGADNPVSIAVENTGRQAARLLLRDDFPVEFDVSPVPLAVRVATRAEARVPFQVVPTERGNFRLGDISLRCRGPLGLAWADRTVEAGETVAVYPNLLEVRRYEALVRATLVRAGGYRSRRLPGAGREFSHFRDYTVDDDYRHVNWKATARRAKPITAVFESEHSQDIIFCLDIGRMMAARVGRLSKLDHAINAVLMLTHVSQTFQDNLGLLVFSHQVHRYLPPAKGQAQYAQFLQALYRVKADLSYVNYREAFQYLIGQHPKRALTMVFTDLLDAVVSAEYQRSVQLLKRFHLPLTLAVADVPLQDLAARTPDSHDELYDVLVARDLLQGRAEMLRGLERQGVMVLDTVPERLTIDAVNRYLALKTGTRI
jgi:uncharacterized protein (DUF58 family)